MYLSKTLQIYSLKFFPKVGIFISLFYPSVLKKCSGLKKTHDINRNLNHKWQYPHSPFHQNYLLSKSRSRIPSINRMTMNKSSTLVYRSFGNGTTKVKYARLFLPLLIFNLKSIINFNQDILM